MAIPRTVHFVYGLRPQTDPFPLHHFLAVRSCRRVNAGFDVVVHVRATPWGPWWERLVAEPGVRIAPIAEPGVRLGDSPPELEAYRYAHESDVVRLEILLAEGGVYADIDSIFVRSLPDAWLDAPAVMGHELPPDGAEGSLCNAWIAAEPGSAFVEQWLREMPAAFDGSWSNHSTLLPYRLSRQHPELVRVLPESALFALRYTAEHLADLLERDVPLPPDAVSLHLWEHLWAAPERRDFSHVHAGLITPAYVRHARTTYARLARPHLPDDVRGSRAAWLRDLARLRLERRARSSDALRRLVRAVR
ncbi:hypothetical protein K8Z61_10635 [Nocardioides sp. TRM66260-LWL]|uniref:glycosyltransferase n=1 Tax=Nocardioides sp. TRM66260-LWL TaxID=2874478 RepID=UPI001CC727A9|nr:glycosyltransferase [Nocardioides sp. TRM66260-LWL]MBZ5734953.1 hypothetical protein [Nocardioides sp. TRM66260-LWL]